jgi:hypothetical protein
VFAAVSTVIFGAEILFWIFLPIFVVVLVVSCRLTSLQQRFLDNIAHEETELDAYALTLEQLRNREDTKSNVVLIEQTLRHVKGALKELEEAKAATYRRDNVSVLESLYSASRQEVWVYRILEREYDEEAKRHETRTVNLARRILSAADELPARKRQLVREYLTTESDGTLNEDVTTAELYSAVRVVQEWNVEVYESAQEVKQYLQLAIIFAVAILFTLYSASVITAFFLPVPSTGLVSSAAQQFAPSIDQVSLFLAVSLLGALGATFSILVKFSSDSYQVETADPDIPNPSYLVEAVTVRVLIGVVSALVLVVLFQSEIGFQVFKADIRDNPLMPLLLAFVGGFFERLAKERLGGFAESISTSESDADANREATDR